MHDSISMQALLQPFGVQAPEIYVQDLVLDSREVGVHTAFVAVIGHQLDGRDFIPQAISLGAKIILAETESVQEHGQLSMREQSVIIAFYQLNQRLSELAVAFYQAPAAELTIIAVTGTNGKTSTVNLSSQLAQFVGKASAAIGTLGVQVFADDMASQGEIETLNTTPDAIRLQSSLRELAQLDIQQVAMEASSHALVQGRMAALKTDIAVFTNLSRDHLDYHGDMATYAAAKRQLLAQPGLKYVVLNQDDPESANWLDKLPQSAEPILCSIGNVALIQSEQLHCVALDIDYHAGGCRFSLHSSWGMADIQLPLLGEFNIANLLAALATQLCQSVPLPELAKYCQSLSSVSGRMQVFSNTDGANIVVDYAHTPDALQQTLNALRAHCQQQLWCVFGCGGDRDKGKRALMGRIAEQQADNVVLTNDNSRTEAPLDIIEDILSGCQQPQKIQVELNRKRAIRMALEQAQQDDLVLVAGKGHENYQIIGQQRLQYDERAYVKTLLGG